MIEIAAGATEEIAFWQGAIDRYLNNPKSSAFGQKLNPDSEIQPAILNRIQQCVAQGQNNIRVLDVGCGPLSTIGKNADGRNLEVIGLDPLTTEYEKMLQSNGLVRPHEAVSGVAERASEYFGRAAFDYVHAENSLDHCQDAALALSELRSVCKLDSIIFFKVFVNEGEHNHYSGYHQWNFDTYNGKPIFWRPGQIHFIDELFQLPMRFWYEEAVHGPNNIPRKYLNCEIHNTDMTNCFAEVGALQVRQLPHFSCLVLMRRSNFLPDARVFAHFEFKDKTREVATLVWPSQQDCYILKVPVGNIKSIKLGQSEARHKPSGEPAWHEYWSNFVPIFQSANWA